MIDTPVIPNCHVIRILPAMSNLQIMIIHNQLHEPFEESFRFQGRHVVDLLNMFANCEDRFPACDGVSTDDGVDGGQFFADVVGGATRGEVEFEVVVLGSLTEFGLRAGGS